MTHPYTQFEGSLIWSVVERAIEDLIENQDLEETTLRHYIVGYIVKKIVDAGIAGPEAFAPAK